MSHKEIRKRFLDFFEKRGHKIVPSSSLIPDDPSVLFTSAGMQQFKKYYLDTDSHYGNKVVSIQKCIRTTDIDEVGDESHLTFFEMLGNFSFKFPEAEDSYFKEEAIKLGYDFIVGELKIPLDRIKISVFKGDSKDNIPEDRESFEIWKSFGVPEDKIIFGDKGDSFWGPTGNQGPCGPTTEIHIDGIEVWNIVFNEYYCDKEKHLVLLQRKGVDTGMGLERLAMVLQNKKSVFETDLFSPLLTEVHGKRLAHDESVIRSERIITDHLKASSFLISDGVLPSNTGPGYILRRLLRRIIRHAKLLNLSEDFYERSVKTIVNIYKNYYPEFKKEQKKIIEAIGEEHRKFIKSLDKGLKEFERLTKDKKTISGADAFNLYQSFGFPIEFTQELAVEKGLKVDLDEFHRQQKEHKKASTVSAKKKFGTYEVS